MIIQSELTNQPACTVLSSSTRCRTVDSRTQYYRAQAGPRARYILAYCTVLAYQGVRQAVSLGGWREGERGRAGGRGDALKDEEEMGEKQK